MTRTDSIGNAFRGGELIAVNRPTTPVDGIRPVFVVGPSRSGTSLVQTILNQHPDLWIARETHYFDDLRPRLKDRASRPLDKVDSVRCERYFLTIGHRPYGQKGDPTQSHVDAGELRAEARTLGGTADAYFEAYCKIRTRQHDKFRWGEKTPRHVFRLDEILACHPSAQIVCLARDPRAVTASYRDWKRRSADHTGTTGKDRERARRSYDPILNAFLWRSAMQASLRARGRYGEDRVHILRYEDLLGDPRPLIRGLAEWLGLQYDPTMLDVPIVYSSYSIAGAGISKEPLDRWRAKLTPTEISVVQTCCRRPMDALGYAPEPVSPPLHRVALTWAAVPIAVLRAALANRARLGRASEYVRRRLLPTCRPNNQPIA
jgi:hypothetical protein